MANSPMPCRRVLPVTVHTIVPGEMSVPTLRNHAAPRRTMPGTLDSVSTLSTSAGAYHPSPPSSANAAPDAECPVRRAVGSTPRRNGGDTLGNAGRPSITSRSPVSSPYRYEPGPSTMRTAMPSVQPAAPISSIAVVEPAALVGERRLGADDHLAGADGVRGDQRPLEHQVRVLQQDRPVLERARLALGGIDHHGRRLRRRGVRGDGAPLQAGGEPGAAAAAQPGIGEQVDEHRRRHRTGGRRAPSPAPDAANEGSGVPVSSRDASGDGGAGIPAAAFCGAGPGCSVITRQCCRSPPRRNPCGWEPGKKRRSD